MSSDVAYVVVEWREGVGGKVLGVFVDRDRAENMARVDRTRRRVHGAPLYTHTRPLARIAC